MENDRQCCYVTWTIFIHVHTTRRSAVSNGFMPLGTTRPASLRSQTRKHAMGRKGTCRPLFHEHAALQHAGTASARRNTQSRYVYSAPQRAHTHCEVLWKNIWLPDWPRAQTPALTALRTTGGHGTSGGTLYGKHSRAQTYWAPPTRAQDAAQTPLRIMLSTQACRRCTRRARRPRWSSRLGR